MSQFTNALVVTPLADGKTWVLVGELGYDVGEVGSYDHVTVEVGFQTDFATIPRLFWIVLPRWGRYGNAAVVHDWLYWIQSRSRRDADYIFREAMGVLGVRAIAKFAIYWAVRLFGWLAWYRNRADKAAGFDRVLKDVEVKASTRSRRPRAVPQVAQYAFRGLR